MPVLDCCEAVSLLLSGLHLEPPSLLVAWQKAWVEHSDFTPGVISQLDFCRRHTPFFHVLLQVLFPLPQHKYKDHFHSPVKWQEGAKERAGITGQTRPAPNFTANHQHSWQHCPPHEPSALAHRHHQVGALFSRLCRHHSDESKYERLIWIYFCFV